MQPYPKILNKTVESNTDALLQIGRLREEDIRDRNNFPNVFMQGRLVGKVPTSSADIAATDRIGDYNIQDDYFYTCVSDGAGGAVWRRIAQGSW